MKEWAEQVYQCQWINFSVSMTWQRTKLEGFSTSSISVNIMLLSPSSSLMKRLKRFSTHFFSLFYSIHNKILPFAFYFGCKGLHCLLQSSKFYVYFFRANEYGSVVFRVYHYIYVFFLTFWEISFFFILVLCLVSYALWMIISIQCT